MSKSAVLVVDKEPTISIDFEEESTEVIAPPPVIVLNRHTKIEPEEIPLSTFLSKKKNERRRSKAALLWLSDQKPVKPIPRRPIYLSWHPEVMTFELNNKEVVKRLDIQNRSFHSLFIHCCGMWDIKETARLGAVWCCYPRTQFKLPPGLNYSIFLHATPKFDSLVPFACIGLQLATSYSTDHVIAFFVVPVKVKFQTYNVPPPSALTDSTEHNQIHSKDSSNLNIK